MVQIIFVLLLTQIVTANKTPMNEHVLSVSKISDLLVGFFLLEAHFNQMLELLFFAMTEPTQSAISVLNSTAKLLIIFSNG
jgi:hypothetical protein